MEVEKIEIERPEYGGNHYIRGCKPRWNVGDVLAEYDYEFLAEYVIGEIVGVELDTHNDDWCYTFSDGDVCLEEMLYDCDAYAKSVKPKGIEYANEYHS